MNTFRASSLKSARIAFVGVTIALVAGCGGENSTQPTPPPALKTYTLAVTRTRGVGGTPVPSRQVLPEGTSVPYSFTLRAGFDNLSVQLDGKQVNASGTIVLTKDVTLTATSDTVVVVTQANAPLVSALKNGCLPPYRGFGRSALCR